MATHTKETLLKLVEKIRYDTTNIQANVTELARAIAALPLPDPKAGTYKCPHDGLTFPSERRQAEHLADVHGDNRQLKAIGERAALETVAAHVGRNAAVAFGHARAAEGPDSSDVSKLTCRDEQADA